MMFIVQQCNFKLNELFYSQLFGTAKGAKFSVVFANIYMHLQLSKYVTAYNDYKPNIIARLIDDCFLQRTRGSWPVCSLYV